MPTTPYAEVTDLKYGDLRLPAYLSPTEYLSSAAEEIDASLGHLIETPIDVPDTAENRPTILLLKKINWLIASGRLVLQLAASGEDRALHAYGKRMLDEGLQYLSMIVDGNIILQGVTWFEGAQDPTGPSIHNEDDVSLVEEFYLNGQRGPFLGESLPIDPSWSPPYAGNNTP